MSRKVQNKNKNKGATMHVPILLVSFEVVGQPKYGL
jgi:hypothetical protein